MKAVIECGGKQYYVEPGQAIYVEKLDKEPGDKVVFENEQVKMVIDAQKGNVDASKAKVEGKVVKHGKQKKIVIFKYKPKKKSTRKKQGHRQPYTQIEITSIK